MDKKRPIQLLLLLVCLMFPYLFANDYILHIMVMAGINVMLVLSLNLIAGFAGQVSLGHAAFFGIGAYASALLALQGLPVWLAMLLSLVITAFCGLLLGYPFLRLHGHFFAIATLGFGEIVHLLLTNWVDLTRGPMGLTGIPRPETLGALAFTAKRDYYYLILLFVALAIYLSYRIKASKMGRALLAIRTDEITAKSMGVHVTSAKMFAFTWSAAIAGLSGAYYAHFALFLSPETFQVSMSINILLMLLIGGMGSIAGAVAGGLFITVLSEYLRIFTEYQMLVYGALIVLIVIFAPRGLSGIAEKLWKLIPHGRIERRNVEKGGGYG